MESEERVKRFALLESWIGNTQVADLVTLLKALAYMPSSADELSIADVRRGLRSALNLGE